MRPKLDTTCRQKHGQIQLAGRNTMQGKTNHTAYQKRLENPKRERDRPFHNRGEGLHSEGRHLLVREVAGRFDIALSLGRLCDEWEGSREETQTLTRSMKTVTCCTDSVVPLVAAQQKVTPSTRHDPTTGNPVPDFKKNIFKNCSILSVNC